MKQSKSSTDRRSEQIRNKHRNANLIVGTLIGSGILVVAALVWNSIGRPALGSAAPAYGEGEHVPDGSPLPVYSTNPPTSGPHYRTPLAEGFYDEDSREANARLNPQGFIVHSMEHGYVVFWYNCSVLTAEACGNLKNQIRTLMNGYNNYKIIAFPWTTTEYPVVATSWGRSLDFQSWDAELAAAFIERNRNQAPEPNAR